ncbi:MAG: DUF167 domain-containing protein [Fibrobacteres bacterium]|jgi:uncharacterized protein (TIGR00251 family)|nr:DUF167 domain-containing protein [Fibrobacterota bacterium]
MDSPGANDLDLRPDGSGCLLKVKVTPRGSSEAVLGIAEGALRIRLTAPPVEGAANAAARAFLSDLLGVPKRAVELARGQTARAKTFRIDGLAPDIVRARLAKSLPA